MQTTISARDDLVALLTAADEPPLDRCALLIAKEEYPEIDLDLYLGQLDAIANQLRDRLGAELDPYLIVGTINRLLFEDLGFAGNSEAYEDPRNSYLSQVLDRRRGIPITLGVVAMEIGRRVGLPIRGISVPGHFLVSYEGADETLFIDCFSRGDIVLPGALQEVLDRTFQGSVRARPEFLEPVSNRTILTRMLNNLKATYAKRRDLRRALRIQDLLLLVNPQSAWEYRDRGLLRFQLRKLSSAEPDLQKYLELDPDARDAGQVRRVMREIRRLRDQPA